MNIFVLDTNPRLAAEAHCDTHVVKMILESAQLLSTAHHLMSGNGAVYKKTHENHPCAIWVREAVQNYAWLWNLFHFLGQEYEFRFKKIHKTIREHEITLAEHPPNYSQIEMTPFKLAMPDDCKIEGDPVNSYRNYYLTYKKDLFRYTERAKPQWMTNNEDMTSYTLTLQAA